MKTNSFISAGLVALAMLVTACEPASNPTSQNNDSQLGGATSGSPGILAKLSEPMAYVDPLNVRNYRLVFSAYATGTSDSEPMVATRTIDKVEFEVRTVNGVLIERLTAREVELSGIRSADDIGSISVTAAVMWPVTASVSNGSYVLAVVRGNHGEVLVRRAEMPSNDN